MRRGVRFYASAFFTGFALVHLLWACSAPTEPAPTPRCWPGQWVDTTWVCGGEPGLVGGGTGAARLANQTKGNAR
jgi:hypothetical protein